MRLTIPSRIQPRWVRLDLCHTEEDFIVCDVFPFQVRHCAAHFIKDEINRIEVYDFACDLRRINIRVEAPIFFCARPVYD